jgi:hypothetical protein
MASSASEVSALQEEVQAVTAELAHLRAAGLALEEEKRGLAARCAGREPGLLAALSLLGFRGGGGCACACCPWCML